MTNLRYCRAGVSFLALAMVCASGPLVPRVGAQAPAGGQVSVNGRQAGKLAIDSPIPQYPPVAKVNYIQGRVRLELTVDPKGRVTNVHVVAGDALLAASAIETLRQWTYRPLSTPFGPAGFVTSVLVKFLLYQDVELTPQRAEEDFLRQVKPAQFVSKPVEGPHDTLHSRLLVNERGEVVDIAVTPDGGAVQREAARQALRGWIFHPAHWGSLPVASYLDLDVPIQRPITRAAINPEVR